MKLKKNSEKQPHINLHHEKEVMIVPLLAGAAKTMVVSMLSEKVVLRVMLLLAEWSSSRSTNKIDDKIVTEIRSKLEADGKL